MDEQRFDAWTRAMTAGEGSRRTAARLLVGGALGLALPGLDGAEAMRRKKKRKKKKKLSPPARNAFGCVGIGGACRGTSTLCCSGLCQGKKPKAGKRDTSTCVAHNVGGCTPERNACTASDFELTRCGENAICTLTTGGAGFCASTLGISLASNCRVCRTDSDCEAQGFPPGSACVILTGGTCNAESESDCNGVNGSSGTACLAAGSAA